jgi:hypothetical protein
VAARPPAQFVAPTDGMLGGGVLAGSMTTSGMPAPRSCPTCAAVSAVPDGGHRDGGGVLGAPFLDPAQDLHRPGAVQAREHYVDEPGAARGALSVARVLVLDE